MPMHQITHDEKQESKMNKPARKVKATNSDYNLNQNQSYIKKFYNGLEVIEAKSDLHIQPNDHDIETAVTNDPMNCIFSRACQRMYGSKTVVFFGTVAYIDLLCSDGKRRVHRFTLPAATKNFIREFDDGLDLDPRGFVLKSPSPQMTVAASTVKNRKNREALIKGESKPPRMKSGPTKPPRTMRLSKFRNGTEMVHFPANEDA